MHVGTQHLFRESVGALMVVAALLAAAWLLSSEGHSWVKARGATAFAATTGAFLYLGDIIGDIRPAELMIVVAGTVVPAVTLVRERLRPGSLPRGPRGWVSVFGPIAILAGLLTRAFVVPGIVCAQHLVDHADVHRRWAFEYRALLELEAVRAERHSASRLQIDDPSLPPSTAIDLVEARGPDGGWAFSATPNGCPTCRSFYLDSTDVMRSARARRATGQDQLVHGNELIYLRYVIDHGCVVMGDVECR